MLVRVPLLLSIDRNTAPLAILYQ
jgi:hypothetical protein